MRLKGYLTHSGRIQETVLNLDSDDTIEKDLNLLSEQILNPFIFVAHCPPWGTPLDVLPNGRHVGSLSIRRFVEHWSKDGRMLASLHGHIHESPNISGATQTRIHDAQCINPGQREHLQFALLEISGDPGATRITLSGSHHD